MTAFLLAGALKQIRKSPTMKLRQVIHSAPIDYRLVDLDEREASCGCRPIPYSPLSTFKLMLLGQLHHFSEAMLQKVLRLRLDFPVFCGFDFGAALPDHLFRISWLEETRRLKCNLQRY